MIRLNLIHGGLARRHTHYLLSVSGRRSRFQKFDTSLPPVGQSSTPSFSKAEAHALTLELLLLMLSGQRQSEAVLTYLAAAELLEPDVWLRDDIRISWLCVLFAARDYWHPWDYAFQHYLGKHPSKLIPLFVERARKHAAMESPKKPPQSVTDPKRRKTA